MKPLLGTYTSGLAGYAALTVLRARREAFGKPDDRVAIYQNQALDSNNAGHLVFIIVGSARTLKEAPPKAPDGPYGMGWRYLHVGFLDLETNQLEPAGG